MKKYPPVCMPDLSGNEQAYVKDAIASSWISSTGAYVNRFERQYAEMCEADWALSVCNGTAALHLALLFKEVKPGDEVIVPSLTFVATANAVRYMGATPVFVDVDPVTWCIHPSAVLDAITERTVGIIAVHLYGNPADLDGLREVAEARDLWIVEDAAEAHLARYKGKPVGAITGLGTFSFYGNKIITSGEGGAVVGRGAGLQALKMLRGQGMDPERRYYHPIIGYNYRLTNVACAILCAQLERADEMIARRRSVVARYHQALSGDVVFQETTPGAEPAPWLTGVVFPSADRKNRVEAALTEVGIETRPFFVPIHALPPYVNMPRGPLEVTEHLARTGLCLPTFPSLGDDTVDEIAECVLRACRG